MSTLTGGGVNSSSGAAESSAAALGETSPEPGCEEAGLAVEVWDGAVIPNYVVGLLNLCAQIELGANYPQGEVRRKPALMREAVELGFMVAGDDNDAVIV
jgi:hypothetical protein